MFVAQRNKLQVCFVEESRRGVKAQYPPFLSASASLREIKTGECVFSESPEQISNLFLHNLKNCAAVICSGTMRNELMRIKINNGRQFMPASDFYLFRQHFLYFLPLPQKQREFLLILISCKPSSRLKSSKSPIICRSTQFFPKAFWTT